MEEWITDKMPEKSGQYIVTEEVYSLENTNVLEKTKIAIAEYDLNRGSWKRARNLKVIAWMSFPEPYKSKM